MTKSAKSPRKTDLLPCPFCGEMPIEESSSRANEELLKKAKSVISWWEGWLAPQEFSQVLEDAEWCDFQRLRLAIAEAERVKENR